MSLKFQSTLSVRRATYTIRHVGLVQLISIHALRKESDYGVRQCQVAHWISIHALRKESDGNSDAWGETAFYFNPRSP